MIPGMMPLVGSQLPTLAQGQTLGNGATLGNPQGVSAQAQQLAALMAQYQQAQGGMERGQEMQGAEYVNNSGSLGVLAAIANKYMGGRIRRKEGEKASDLTQRILSAQTEAERQKLMEEERRKLASEQASRERRKVEGEQAGLQGRDLYEYAYTGKFPEGAKPPSSFQEFSLAKDSPEYMQFLKDSQASKGTKVSVTLPGQNYAKPFDEALAKSDVGRFEKARDAAGAAQDQLNALAGIDSILANTQTGKPQEFYGKLSQYFGAPAGATYQAQQALVNEQVNAILNAAKGPQTDQDAERARASIPSMGTDARARQVVMGYLRKKLAGTIQEAGQMEDYLRQNQSLQGYRPGQRPFQTDARAVGGRGVQELSDDDLLQSLRGGK